jgi:alanine racemase
MTSWIEISEERLAANYRAIAKAVGSETAVLGVIKANAYGHGVERCAVALARAGAPWLGVTTASEGAQVRQALRDAGFSPDGLQSLLPQGQNPLGKQPQILVMCGFLPEDVEMIAKHKLTPVVWTPEQVGWLHGTGLAVHVEIDTGMSRQGVRPGAELDDLLVWLSNAGLTLDGVFTHFCAAEVAHSGLTQTQERRFEAAIAQVSEQALAPLWIHAGSSSTVDNPAQASPWLVDLAKSVGARAMVRCGCALYGYCVPIEGADAASVPSKLSSSLRPVMTWKTRVLSLRDLAVGDSVGYNATFTATAPMRLAMLPVGYSDGLRRELSGSNQRPGGWVMLRTRNAAGQLVEHRAAIVGRVSMNLTMVDVTGIADAQFGDEAILLGDGITADDHARLAKTIPYEILCGVRAG